MSTGPLCFREQCLKLTVIDKCVSAGEEVTRRFVLVGVEGEREGAVQGHPPSGWYGTAEPTTKRRVDQLRGVWLDHFGIHVHVLMDTAA